MSRRIIEGELDYEAACNFDFNQPDPASFAGVVRKAVDAAFAGRVLSGPSEDMIERAANAWFNVEAGIEDLEFGEELRWPEIDEIVRRDYRQKAERALVAALWGDES